MPKRRTKKSLSKKRLTKQVRGRGKKSRRSKRRSRSKHKYNLKGGAANATFQNFMTYNCNCMR